MILVLPVLSSRNNDGGVGPNLLIGFPPSAAIDGAPFLGPNLNLLDSGLVRDFALFSYARRPIVN